MFIPLLCIYTLLNWGCTQVMKKIEPEYKPCDIVEVSTGRILTLEELCIQLRDIPILFIGETHNNPDHHLFQREVIEILYHTGEAMAIGMEMFPREVRPILDRWTQDGMEEHEFLEEVGWSDVWGFPFSLYRDILVFAKEHHIDVVGLNAPPGIIRKVSEGGLDSLGVVDRAKIATEINLNNKAHRNLIAKRFAEHPPTQSKFETFYQAQRVRDETMAESLVEIFANSPSHIKRIVVLAGSGHIFCGLGIPDAFARRSDMPFAIIISGAGEDVDRLIQENAADYVKVGKFLPSHFRRPMIGLVLNPEELKNGRLVVAGIIKKSVAEKMGLKVNDEIERVNAKIVRKSKDIHDALKLSKDFSNHTMTVNRKGSRIELFFKLPFK